MKYRKIDIVFYFLLIVSVIFIFFTPSWWNNASLDILKEWYPRFGYVFYFFIHYSFYLTLILLAFIIKWKNLISKTIQNEKRTRLIVYPFIVLVLFLQYGYSLRYEEPFPAVMMPSFKNGRNPDVIQTHNILILIQPQSSNAFFINANKLFFDSPFPETKKSIISETLVRKELDAKTLKWIKKRICQLYPSIAVKTITCIDKCEQFNVLPNIHKDKTEYVKYKSYSL